MANGKRVKAKTSTGTGALSGGLSECVPPTGTTPMSGYAVGTKNIPALFWNPMLSTRGKKEIKGQKGIGDD